MNTSIQQIGVQTTKTSYPTSQHGSKNVKTCHWTSSTTRSSHTTEEFRCSVYKLSKQLLFSRG